MGDDEHRSKVVSSYCLIINSDKFQPQISAESQDLLVVRGQHDQTAGIRPEGVHQSELSTAVDSLRQAEGPWVECACVRGLRSCVLSTQHQRTTAWNRPALARLSQLSAPLEQSTPAQRARPACVCVCVRERKKEREREREKEREEYVLRCTMGTESESVCVCARVCESESESE